MKSIRGSILVLIFMTALFTPQSGYSRMGGISSNGGDGVVAEFFEIARSLLETLKQQNSTSIDLKLFEKTIQNAKIYSQDFVYLEKNQVSAINTPALQEIRVSRKHWAEYTNFPKKKYVLVLHEFLGLMKYKDRTFSISNSILEGPGIAIQQFSCPLLKIDSITGASNYSLEFVKYKVGNYYDYRTIVYYKGLPDQDSQAMSVEKIRMKDDETYETEIGTIGSAIVQISQPLTRGYFTHFELWPLGEKLIIQSKVENLGEAALLNADCVERITH